LLHFFPLTQSKSGPDPKFSSDLQPGSNPNSTNLLYPGSSPSEIQCPSLLCCCHTYVNIEEMSNEQSSRGTPGNERIVSLSSLESELPWTEAKRRLLLLCKSNVNEKHTAY